MNETDFVLDNDLLEVVGGVDAVKNGNNSSRSWMMTIKAEQFNKETVEDLLKNYSYVGQLEKGSKRGYQHWQVYIENPTPIKFSTLKNKFPTGAWFAARKGTKLQALTYVSKTDTSMGVKIRNGEINMTEDGKRSDLDNFYQQVREGDTVEDILYGNNKAVKYYTSLKRLKTTVDEKEKSSKWRDVDVEYMWGSTGVGKSRSLNDSFDDVYIVSDYGHPFDEYRGEDVLIFDEFNSQLPIELMLRALDGYKYRLPARYENRLALYTKVFIVSNVSLAAQYRDIQIERPEQFNAFRRRINRVNHIAVPLYDDISIELAPLS